MHEKLESEETTNIVKKLTDEVEIETKRKYVSMKVIGNPLDKKHLDTEVILQT